MSSQSPHHINHAPASSASSGHPHLPLPRDENGSQSLPSPIPPQYGLQPLPPIIADLQGRPSPAPGGVFYPPSAAPNISMGGRILSPHLHSLPMHLAENASPLPASFHLVPSGYSPSIVPNGRSGMMAYSGSASSGGQSSDGGITSAENRRLDAPQPEQHMQNGTESGKDLASGLNGLSLTPAQSAPLDSASNPTEGSVFAPSQDLQPYIYNMGFIHAAWTDTFLSIPPHTTLRLHALLISRSPTLYQFLLPLAGQGPPYNIQINDADTNLSAAAISMTLATLYGQPLGIDSPNLDIAKGLIAAGHLFGLEDVARAGYGALQSLFSLESLPELFAFALEGGLPSPASAAGAASSSSNGSTPSTDEAQRDKRDNITVTYPGPYPKYTETLLASLLAYLIDNIDHDFIQRPNTPPQLRSLLLSLPFHLFKHVCESDNLKCKSQMERYGFARDLIGERERRRRKSGSGLHEEGVVLAFGGGKGGVEVIRKPTGKKKVLWKASQ
ncbi:hypothetical protein V1509DRAFT_623890 [Lipomyces kononenkoae]